VVKKFVVRIMCILICIGITMSMPACSSESKNEKVQISSDHALYTVALTLCHLAILGVHVCLILLCLLKIR
jgi:hypothetical protein